jgi:DNA-binding protein H-NS
MTGIVTAFKALPLDAQTQAYPQITATFNAAKDARRLQREAEIRALGFRPGEGKKKVERTAEYVGPNSEVWSGAGAMTSWLRKVKDAGQDIEEFRV